MKSFEFVKKNSKIGPGEIRTGDLLEYLCTGNALTNWASVHMCLKAGANELQARVIFPLSRLRAKLHLLQFKFWEFCVGLRATLWPLQILKSSTSNINSIQRHGSIGFIILNMMVVFVLSNLSYFVRSQFGPWNPSYGKFRFRPWKFNQTMQKACKLPSKHKTNHKTC